MTNSSTGWPPSIEMPAAIKSVLNKFRLFSLRERLNSGRFRMTKSWTGMDFLAGCFPLLMSQTWVSRVIVKSLMKREKFSIRTRWTAKSDSIVKRRFMLAGFPDRTQKIAKTKRICTGDRKDRGDLGGTEALQSLDLGWGYWADLEA